MTLQTRFLQDILRQPGEMQRAIEFLAGAGQGELERAISTIKAAPHVFVTGIGASWNAGLAAGSLFHMAGVPVHLHEAGELLHFTVIPRGALIVMISRTGRSIEIVQLLAKAHAAGAKIIGVTNSPESPLAQESEVAIVVPTVLDHGISVNAYSSLLIAAAALTSSSLDQFGSVARSLQSAIKEAEQRLQPWQKQLELSSWFAVGMPYYFLARGASLGSCQEARLLWEEGVKMPATAMSTSSFRHGPQEIVKKGVRFGLWIDQSQMREQDLAVACDLRELGASVMVIGENLPNEAGDLVCQLPPSPPHWQFVVDMLPIQLAAERLSRMAGVDCDSFLICSYVVEDEHGLLRKKVEASPNGD